MDKTLKVRGARISYSIWEVGGDKRSQDHILTACKDSIAILFMFDLTSRCTLNGIIRWYKQARKWNKFQSAIKFSFFLFRGSKRSVSHNIKLSLCLDFYIQVLCIGL